VSRKWARRAEATAAQPAPEVETVGPALTEAVAAVAVAAFEGPEVRVHLDRAVEAPGEEPACTRLTTFDSLRWRCACGASGRVPRTPGGMPDTSGDVLRHLPGVSRE
jgi:hypothetical protein